MNPTKNLYLSICCLILALTIGLSGCTKAPINGDLDGMWEVMEVSVGEETRKPDSRIFYNFSLHVCMLTFFGAPFTDGNMVYENNRLSLEFPYVVTPEYMEILEDYGIYSNPVTFTVEFPNKKSLLLKDGEVTVTLRKF